jgi:YVTN family beta-propeller protein
MRRTITTSALAITLFGMMGCEDASAPEAESDNITQGASCHPLARDRELISGATLLVALENGGVVALDPHSGELLHQYATGPNAFGAAFTPDGARAFVTDKDAGTLSEIDPTSDEVLGQLDIGTTPQQLAITSSGRLYVTLSGEAAIGVVDVASTPMTLLRKIDIGAGTKPHVLSLSPDETKLWATVQGMDPKVVSIELTDAGEGAIQEFHYDIVPRVVAASNRNAYFTGHHSTGFHMVNGADGVVSTPYMDVNGDASEAKKQIEGAWTNADGSLFALTHEGRKALVVLALDEGGKPRMVRNIDNLSAKPYWVMLDPSERVAYVSIPDSNTVCIGGYPSRAIVVRANSRLGLDAVA